LKSQIKNKDYFLIGFDLCSNATKYFTSLKEEFKDQENKFILITGDTNFKLIFANKQFKNKYVFYSPSITTGISFVYSELSQTQFIHISNKALITPISIFQMSCRTRNMKELIYYCDKFTDIQLKYKSLEDLETHYKNMIILNEKLLSLSKSTNDDDAVSIVNNMLFKIFTFSEFQRLVFKTGFIKHYENILSIKGGFNLISIGETKKLEKNKNDELKQNIKIHEDKLISVIILNLISLKS